MQALKTPFSGNQNFGFTLLELMVVLGIVGILVAVAAPGMEALTKGSSISAGRDALANAIKTARGEAIYRKAPATVCASTDQSSCSGGSDWDQGWIVFSDANGNGSFDGGSDTLIDVNYGNNNIRVGTDGSGGTLTFAATGMRVIAGEQIIGICDEDTGSGLIGEAMQISTVGGIRYQGSPGC